jgi:hypothetical protein
MKHALAMICDWPRRIVLGLAGAAFVTFSAHAGACTIAVSPEVKLEGPPPNFSDQCRAAARDPAKFLAEQGDEALPNHEALAVARALREGEFGCRKRPGVALDLVDRVIGSPVTLPRGSAAVLDYLDWTQDEPASERRDEVVIGAWIANSSYVSGFCSGYYEDALPYGRGEDAVLPYLLRPEYWAIARDKFGNNPARDRLVLRRLIDPASEKFDLALAAEMAPHFRGRRDSSRLDPVVIDVAEALTDPRLGPPDYEAAAKVLGAYSLYAWIDVSDDEVARLRPLWTRILQSRLTHPDEQVRREALYALGTGDPSAQPGVAWAAQMPEGANLVRLDQWPVSLPPLTNLAGAAARIAENYPKRAQHEMQAGRVELGIVFGPDGKFDDVIVTRSAGLTLDQAAARDAERYLRPRLSDMVLKGFEGQSVYVPLPAFEYRISTILDNTAEGLNADGTKIVILAQPFRQTNY